MERRLMDLDILMVRMVVNELVWLVVHRIGGGMFGVMLDDWDFFAHSILFKSIVSSGLLFFFFTWR